MQSASQRLSLELATLPPNPRQAHNPKSKNISPVHSKQTESLRSAPESEAHSDPGDKWVRRMDSGARSFHGLLSQKSEDTNPLAWTEPIRPKSQVGQEKTCETHPCRFHPLARTVIAGGQSEPNLVRGVSPLARRILLADLRSGWR